MGDANPKTEPSSGRLSILRQSLAQKQAEFDRRIAEHFSDVQSANGQPLNDKRNGGSTLARWDRQENALRRLKDGIERTKRAIEREEAKVANVAAADIPDVLRGMVARGELTQWRRHPNTFFVPGVDRGRIVWDAKSGTLGIRYLSEITKEQYPVFRDVFNAAKAALRQEVGR